MAGMQMGPKSKEILRKKTNKICVGQIVARDKKKLCHHKEDKNISQGRKLDKIHPLPITFSMPVHHSKTLCRLC